MSPHRSSALIITATPNKSWLHPEFPYPEGPAALAEEAVKCQANGAAVLHVHSRTEWAAVIKAVRSASTLLVQCGMSSLALEERLDVFEYYGDMISVITNHHDEAFPEGNTNVLHSMEELERYAELSWQSGVRPEFEIWNSGSVWNLRYLMTHAQLVSPIVCTLFFGWPGGTWSPPTVEEYLSRRRLVPDESVVAVSVMGPERYAILAAAIALGDHVRVGTEDHPFSRSGVPAQTSELVAEAAELARALGRPVASPEKARQLLGLAGPSRGGDGPAR